MIDYQNIKSLYAAFDLYPSHKGSATHITAFSKVLFNLYPHGLLYALGENEKPEYYRNFSLLHFSQKIKNYLQRAKAFSDELYHTVQECPSLEICHFRDIWSGLGILHSDQNFRTVFEINGLPSIELKYRYPQISDSTIKKIQKMERFCMEESQIIVTPSKTTQQYLIDNGAAKKKIKLIPNGAQIHKFDIRRSDRNHPYIVYFGALQSWQGIDVLLKAFAQLQDLSNLSLLIVSSQHAKFAKPYIKLAEKLGIHQRLNWMYQLDREYLIHYVHQALVSVAPLKECDRNIKQGCSPLKILESMALETAVLASDLPPVREIITDNVNGKLFRADRPTELARTIRSMIENPENTEKIASKGLHTVKAKYQWSQQQKKLKAIYQNIYAY